MASNINLQIQKEDKPKEIYDKPKEIYAKTHHNQTSKNKKLK